MKKNTLRFLATILTFFLMLHPSAAFSATVDALEKNLTDFESAKKNTIHVGTCNEDVFWRFDEETGKLTIYGEGVMPDYGNPDYYNYPSGLSYSNEETPWEDFKESIKLIYIEYGISYIGDYAFFDCYNCESVVIESAVVIGTLAFGCCKNLVNVIIPEELYWIGDAAFYGCEYLNGIDFIDLATPDDADSYYHYSTNRINISKNVTYIGKDAFYYCSSISKFSVDEANSDYSDMSGVLFNRDKTELICCPNQKYGAYKIPNSVTKIHRMAFANCQSLTSVEIPKSVEHIGDYAFMECYALQAINVNSENQRYTSLNGVLYDYLNIPRDYVMDYYMDIINIDDFEDRVKLMLYPPAKADKTFEIPYGVEVVSDYAFYLCGNLMSVYIPDTVIYVGEDAFNSCWNLNKITMSANIRNIEFNAFFGTKYTQQSKNWENGVLYIENAVIYIDDKEAGETLILKDGTTCIASGACTHFSKRGLVIPDTVNYIGTWAFLGCDTLETVILPNSLVNVASDAFACCSSLEKVFFPEPEWCWLYYSIFDGSNNAVIFGVPGGFIEDTAKKGGWNFIGIEQFGDVTGDTQVSMKDVTKLQRVIAELEDFDNSNGEYAADVCFDNKINMRDVVTMQRYIADLIPSVPSL